jgi:NAD(P)H-dependent FMN reductase
MKAALISGSPRPNSQSSRVAAYVERRMMSLFPDAHVNTIDLARIDLPSWSGDFASHPASDPASAWSGTSKVLEQSDALIAVVPEHHGIVPPAFMNLLLQVRYELAHKPALIIAISATDGGAYPAAQLRGSAAKNNRICWIPEQVVIRNVKQMLQEDSLDSVASDYRIKSRVDYALKLLHLYQHALCEVRASGVIDHDTFSFGL